jgi:hypothetical protein
VYILIHVHTHAGVIGAGTKYAARLNYLRVRITKNVQMRLAASTSVCAKAATMLIAKNLLAVLRYASISVGLFCAYNRSLLRLILGLF